MRVIKIIENKTHRDFYKGRIAILLSRDHTKRIGNSLSMQRLQPIGTLHNFTLLLTFASTLVESTEQAPLVFLSVTLM